MHVRFALALLATALMFSCASAPQTTAPILTNVPGTVLDAFCARLRQEGVSSEMSLVRTTQPLITAASLRSLAHSYYRDGETSSLAQVLNAALKPVPVDVASSTACSWKPIDKLDPVAHVQSAVVELSTPFPNPFSKGEGGVLARISIGGENAQWYWVPLAEKKGQLGVGIVLPMDLHAN